jgi:hypothetical protein
MNFARIIITIVIIIIITSIARVRKSKRVYDFVCV